MSPSKSDSERYSGIQELQGFLKGAKGHQIIEEAYGNANKAGGFVNPLGRAHERNVGKALRKTINLRKTIGQCEAAAVRAGTSLRVRSMVRGFLDRTTKRLLGLQVNYHVLKQMRK